MKMIFALTAAAALAACTATPEMIEAQKSRCTQVGYVPGTIEHAQCAERGTQQQQQMQNAALGVAGSYAGAAVLTELMY